MSDIRGLYHTDFLAWTREQAEALRGVGRAVPVDGTNRALDWEKLAEEIEDLGTSQRLALTSRIRRVLVHLLELEFSPATAPRDRWRASIRDARAEIEDLLETSPSLRREIAEVVARVHRRAARDAVAALEDEEEAGPGLRDRVEARSFDPDSEVLADWWPRSQALASRA